LTPLAELEPANVFTQFILAGSLVETGNLPDYRARCQKIAAGFRGSSDCSTLFFAAQACLLIPGTGCDLQTAAQLADRAVALGSQKSSIHYFEFAEGLAEYRRSHFARSIEWLQKAIQGDKTTPDENNEMAAYAVMAMAENQLQHPAPARAALAESLEIARTKVAAQGSPDLGADWHTWLVAHILLREAQAEIRTP
jgi:tetratricopeptide (TPR) repeat protein